MSDTNTQPPADGARTPRSKWASRPRNVILTTVVLGMLFLVAGVPGVDGGDRLEASKVRLVDAVQLARALATTTGRPHSVAFDYDHDSFAVVDMLQGTVDDPFTADPALYDLEEYGVRLKEIDFGASHHMLTFDENGVAANAGRIVLMADDDLLTLRFDPTSGRLVE